MDETWIEDEAAAGPRNAMTRKGRAWMVVDGVRVLRSFRAALPDTFYTCPAFVYQHGKRVHGYVIKENGELTFKENR